MSRRNFLSSAVRAALVSSAIPGTLMPPAVAVATRQPANPELVLDDPGGNLGRTGAPACVSVALPDRLREAAREGRLALREKLSNAALGLQIPAQCLPSSTSGETPICWLVPAGNGVRRVFSVETMVHSPARLAVLCVGGRYQIVENDKAVLCYNYSTIEPGDLVKSIAEENRKYAVPRSDYIHPLYGPNGESLTKDWSAEHPHHRGIYWAWPEVDWRGERADLHALQDVFARPTGKCKVLSGAVFAELRAENLWHWKDRDPIVRELAIIRAYAASPTGRLVDLELHFEAVGDPVLLARRGTTHYGGLNVRLSAIKDQRITKRSSPPEVTPSLAWADISGTFTGAAQPAGLTLVQRASNPDYPGDWVEYPELDWLQPTFPSAGSRYELRPGKPLALRYRLQIHPGSPLSQEAGDACWRAANLSDAL